MMLSAINEASVNTVENTGLETVELALQLLNNTSREVQHDGWNFNTEKEKILLTDSNGYVYIPNNTLRVDTTHSSRVIKVTQRGNRLYNLSENGFIFDDKVTVELILEIDFEDLPFHAQNYIIKKAGRKFVTSYTQSDVGYQFTKEDEIEALRMLKNAECSNRDISFVGSDRGLQRMVYRDRI